MGNIVEFQCSKKVPFDVIVFATGYKSTANIWLKVITLMFEYVLSFFLGAIIVRSVDKLYVDFFIAEWREHVKSQWTAHQRISKSLER